MFLTVEFPAFKSPIVYHQKTCNPSLPELLPMSDRDRIILLHDPEINKENPIENKYHKLARSTKGLNDRDLKPNVEQRREIAVRCSSSSFFVVVFSCSFSCLLV